MSKYTYILFPLPLLQEIFKKPKNGLNEILLYGIYRTAVAMEDEHTNDVAALIINCYYRGGLTARIEEMMTKLVEHEVFFPDLDSPGFDGEHFNPLHEIHDLKEFLDENEEYRKEFSEFYYLKILQKKLNLNFNIEDVIDIYNKYNKQYNDFINQPLVMVNSKMLRDFCYQEKTEFEKVLFATYAGIRSIMGRDDSIAETTHAMIFYRMVGAKNKKALDEILENDKVKHIYKKYNVRYQREKILNELVARNFLSSKLAYNKRTYLSCTISFTELPRAIEKRLENKNTNFKIKLNKQNELEAKKQLLRLLNK